MDIPTNAYVALLLPFVMIVLSVILLNPAKRLVAKYLKDGKLKRILLFRVN